MIGPVDCVIQIDARRWLRFTHPAQVVETDRVSDVGACLREIESQSRISDRYAVGFVRYEAGGAFGLDVRPDRDAMPLVWFALFERSNIRTVDSLERSGPYDIGELKPSIGREAFASAFADIRARIAAGDTYQVNYTWRLSAPFSGDAATFFADLCAAQRGRYSAFVRTDRFAICSASPELFLERHEEQLTSRPMKGTARRGLSSVDDLANGSRLRESPKERAENVMVVDMVRNDLGRVAEVGSVAVPELFALERYPNVWQMTSTVTARSRASIEEIFAATFPSASVTGAPKHRTMQIIAGLEAGHRGVYTGAVGMVAPDGAARFNVAIRTAVIDRRTSTLEFGVGSGIVWDSNPDREYDECLLKGSVLGQRPVPFELLETLRWSPAEGFVLLDRHLSRLRASAEYFGFAMPIDAVQEALAQAVASGGGVLRVRLLVAEDGTPRVEAAPLEESADPVRVAIASEPVDPTDVFLFHKTTNRRQHDRARSNRSDDVILWNPDGEVTESTIANVVVEIGGRKVTPPVRCGLLAGTFRAELLETGQISEAPIPLAQLRSAARFWLVNSVRGWRTAVLDAEGKR